MTLTKKNLLSGILALSVGLSLAMPMRASADDWDHDHDHHHHMWQPKHDDDDYRGYSYRRHDDDDYRIYPNRTVGPNGEGLINRRNPNFFWACDSEGHHCHWARR
jgi:hypothetical protein